MFVMPRHRHFLTNASAYQSPLRRGRSYIREKRGKDPLDDLKCSILFPLLLYYREHLTDCKEIPDNRESSIQRFGSAERRAREEAPSSLIASRRTGSFASSRCQLCLGHLFLRKASVARDPFVISQFFFFFFSRIAERVDSSLA